MNTPLADLSSEPNPPSNHKVHLVWGSVFVITCALIVFTLKTANDTAVNDIKIGYEKIVGDLKSTVASATGKLEDYARKAAEKVEAVAARYKTGTITETFKSESPIFELIKVGRLEVAVAESDETFRREDEEKYFWGLLNPGPTVSEIKVPATYRYHLDMAEDWKIEIKDKCCVVHAPSLKPSLPVAFKTDKMEKKSETSWGRFDGAQQLDKLEKQITPRLNDRASKPGHMNAARREARDVVARFVRTWLLNSQQWQNDRFTSITVIFANETPEEVSLKPTLTIDQQP